MLRRRTRELLEDLAIALLWTVLIVAILVFAAGGSSFIYVNF